MHLFSSRTLFSPRARISSRALAAAVVGGGLLTGLAGCAGLGRCCQTGSAQPNACETTCCDAGSGEAPCCNAGWRQGGWRPFGGGMLFGGAGLRSRAIPDRYPLGSVVREPFHVMQTNAEATDFVFYRNDFVGDTSELTPDGKDHIMEIAARMRSAPFPVLIERSENNANPQLDAERRLMVAQVLYEHGNADADQRTFVSPAYSRGLTDYEPRAEYYRFMYTRGNVTGLNNQFGGGNGGFGGGFGGGGFGGGYGGGGFY